MDYFPIVNQILASIPRNSQNMHAIFSLFQLKREFLICIPVYVETYIHFPVKCGQGKSEELERSFSNITTL